MADYRELLSKLAVSLHGCTLLTDLIIKKILGMPNDSEERLLSFLNAVLKQGDGPVLEEVSILDRLNPPLKMDKKATYLDIKAKDSTGRLYNIEVQMNAQDYFVSRFIYYVTRLHSSQLAKGEDYNLIRPTIGIALTNFVVCEDSPKAFRPYGLMSKEEKPVCLSDDLQFYFVQMPLLTTSQLSGLNSDLADWLQFLYYPQTSPEKMNTIMAENTLLAQTGEVVYDFTEANEDWLEALEKARRNQQDEYDTAVRIGVDKERPKILEEGRALGRAEGMAEGMAKGREEGMAEGMAKGMAKGGIVAFADYICETAIEKFGVEISPYFANELYSLTVKQLQRINSQMFSLQTIEQLESLIDDVAHE